MPEENVFSLRAHFSGRVQGVGFRYKVLQIAREFDVAGYVQNLADGRVRMEAEGAEKEVRAFFDRAQEVLNVFIRKTEEATERRPPTFSGFEIR